MQLFDPNNPNEKKKIIAAVVLAIVAIGVLGYLFLGGSGSKKPATPRPTATQTVTTKQPKGDQATDIPDDDPSKYQPIVFNGTVPAVSEADRNIFSYYEPPPPQVKPTPTPTPTPPPPLTLNSVSPSNVYARTGDFSLQVMGEKFTPPVRINLDGRELPTRFISPQQLATTVSSDLILNPGTRQIIVRTADGKLYSNSSTLVVTPPPDPRASFSYIGIIGKPRGNDTAVLQDKNSKDLLNVQRGDVIGGRFRVNSISDTEIVLMDTTLKIRHTLTFTAENNNPQSRPPTRRPVVDEEP